MKKLLLIGLSLGLCSVVYAQPQGGFGGPPPMGGQGPKRMDDSCKKLILKTCSSLGYSVEMPEPPARPDFKNGERPARPSKEEMNAKREEMNSKVAKIWECIQADEEKSNLITDECEEQLPSQRN